MQFLPVFNPLYEEAYSKAAQVSFQGVPVRVMTAEHLVAVMLQTGRPKDQVRLIQFMEARAVDEIKLRRILKRYNLELEWHMFLRRHRVQRPIRRAKGRSRRE